MLSLELLCVGPLAARPASVLDPGPSAREAAAEDRRGTAGFNAAAEYEARYWRLVDRVDLLIQDGRPLEAKLEIEHSALAELSDRWSPESAALSVRMGLEEMMRQMSGLLINGESAPSFSRADDVFDLIDRVLSELFARGIMAMAGGDNRLFLETFAEPQDFRDRSGSLHHGYGVDCDSATVLMFTVLDELQRYIAGSGGRPVGSSRQSPAISVVSYSEHLAMRVEGRFGDSWIGDMNTPPDPKTGRVRVRWWDEAFYRQRMFERFGEHGVVLRDWGEVLTNTWEVAAARLFEGRRYGAALFFARQAIAANGASAGAHNTLALALSGLERLDEAAEALEQAAVLKTRGSRILSNLANVYLKLGRFQEAFDVSDSALHLDPRLRSALLHRRFARSQLGDAEGANADWLAYLDLIGSAPGPLVSADP